MAGAACCAAGAPGQAPSPVLVPVGRVPSSGASANVPVSHCSRNSVASFINIFSLCEVPRQTSGHTPSGLFVPLYLLMTRSPILSHLGSSGSTSSGLGLCMEVYFRLLRPILFSIPAALGLTHVGETSETLPVVPLELQPPVSTGSSNITLSLSLALPSAVKVQVVLLVNSKRSSSSFNSSRVGSLSIVEPSSSKMGVLSSILLSNMWVCLISVFSRERSLLSLLSRRGNL